MIKKMIFIIAFLIAAIFAGCGSGGGSGLSDSAASNGTGSQEDTSGVDNKECISLPGARLICE